MNVALLIAGSISLLSIGGLIYLAWALRKSQASVQEAWGYRWEEHAAATKIEMAYRDLKIEHAKMASVLEEKEAELNGAIAQRDVADRHRRELLQRLSQNLDTRDLVSAINLELQNLSRLSRAYAAPGGARQGTVHGTASSVARSVAGKPVAGK